MKKNSNLKDKPNMSTISKEVKDILETNKNYQFVQNKTCPFFPCHKNIPIEEFNCLFCYCPLYALNKDCGGNYKILADGTKDCSQCLFPHKKANYNSLINKLDNLISKIKETNNKE